MPAQVPASFASAAASSSSNENAAHGRSVGGNGEWSRPRPNGATQTFRRPSQINTASSSKESSAQATYTPTSGVYVPPHLSSNYQSSLSRNSTVSDLRYSKEQLLDVFKSNNESSMKNEYLQNALTEGWAPGSSAASNRGDWTRRDEARDGQNNPEVCWLFDGLVQPMGLVDMTEEEKEILSTSVNSPLKGLTPNNTKEGMSTPGLNGRKSSISQGQGGSGSAMQGRPGPRRRETSDSISGNPLATPSGFSRSSRDDAPLATPPLSLLRRRTDFKEGTSGSPFERARLDAGIDTSSAFPSWKRNVSGPMSAGVTGPASPWAPSGPQSAGFGAFGNFSIENAGAAPSTPGEKRLGFGSLRGESRLKGLMSKESSEDMLAMGKEKSYSGLEKLTESENGTRSVSNHGARKPPNFFGEEERIGSAALGGDEPSPPARPYSGTVEQKRAHDDIGFSSFNPPSNLGAIRELVARRDATSQETPQSQHFNEQGYEQMSPTVTNPYQSPEGEKSTEGESEDDSRRTPFGLRGQSSRQLASAYDVDRGQTSSIGQQRPFPGLGGLGGLSGVGGSGPWSAGPGGMGQQSLAGQGFVPGFSDAIFGSMGDLSSAGGGFGTPTSGVFGGAVRSKMGSLFPNQVQEQTRSNDSKSETPLSDSWAGFTPHSKESEIPPPSTRGVLDELFGTGDLHGIEGMQANMNQLTANNSVQAAQNQNVTTTSAAPTTTSSGSLSLLGRSPEPDLNANQPPPAQQRQMVMPDRMRWIYRDPSGNMQGPFSGLEMHDWYKAGFFSPELQVKKLEDTDYEPLAQLIRRIGNSREPFLVPQIGIPHGQPTGPGALGATTPGAQPGNAQPRFGNSFPSFGTTLTADQQNALERRKQEEQYLMARQKEHLAQQQMFMKQIQMTGMPMHPQQLHHHSSAHSLQSQPSYGSIASPSGFQPSPGQPPIHPPASNTGFFESPMRSGFGPQGLPGDAMPGGRDGNLLSSIDRLNLGPAGPDSLTAMSQQQEGFHHQQRIANMMEDRARLQAQQEQWESLEKGESHENADRLDQFHQLRTQDNEEPHTQNVAAATPSTQEAGERHAAFQEQQKSRLLRQQSPTQSEIGFIAPAHDKQDLIEVTPQLSTSPLPAPSAQRNRTHIADVLAAESGSRSQSPVGTPTTANLAPWAKENLEGPRGPSLKEIQEAEARKSSQREETAAAARRAVAEQERIVAAQAAQSQAPAPGLPSSANWATGSPATVTIGVVPWAKPLAKKIATPTTPNSKSIAQIQKEEEARKTKAAAVTATAGASVAVAPNIAGGKRYADLASKVAASTTIAPIGGTWTMVGASGKVKVPSSPSVSFVPQRTASGSTTPSVATAPKTKPAGPARGNTTIASAQTAHDEFQRWVKNSLGKGLNSGVNVDDFVRNLLQLPPESDILSEAIYGNSQTLDGHRFAEEFIRRRKQADKGIAPETSAGGNFLSGGSDSNKGSAGDWSEVAKKAPSNTARDETSSSFKVVAAKKKGKR